MPSPGMVTTVCFAIEVPFPDSRDPDRSVLCSFHPPLLRVGGREAEGPAFRRASVLSDAGSHCALQLLPYQVLNSSRDHQRLRHTAQRREGELFARITNGARCKVDFDGIFAEDRLLFSCDRFGEARAQ